MAHNSWQCSFKLFHIPTVKYSTYPNPQMRVESEFKYSRLTSNLRGSFGRGGGLTAPRHQISFCGSNSGPVKKKSRKLYEWMIPPVRSAALWGRASTTTGMGVFPDVCFQPLTENLGRVIDDKYSGTSMQRPPWGRILGSLSNDGGDAKDDA